jgi:NADH dehydrogenase
MMPGMKRKLRLLVDWNVQLLFGRDLSELGQLGHPARLEQPTAGGTPAGESPTVAD